MNKLASKIAVFLCLLFATAWAIHAAESAVVEKDVNLKNKVLTKKLAGTTQPSEKDLAKKLSEISEEKDKTKSKVPDAKTLKVEQTGREGAGVVVIPPSPLELSYAEFLKGEAFQFIDMPKEALPQIGYEYFNQPPTQFLAESRTTQSNFTLLPGDVIEVATYGTMDLRLEASLDQQSNIFFEKVGVISLQGLDFQQAEGVLRKRFEEYFIGSKVYVRLLAQVTRSITVLGKVAQPGLQVLHGQGTIMEALALAGGVSKLGSLRRIEVKRGVEKLNVDLYDVFITGQHLPIQLKGGEVIYVHDIGPTVALVGEVLQKGIYEIKAGENYESLLAKTANYSPMASREQVHVFRSGVSGHKVDVLSIDKNQQKTHLPETFDLIMVPKRQHNVGQLVTIKGAVQIPGSYELKEKENLAQMIAKAGGLSRIHGHRILIQRRLPVAQFLDRSHRNSSRIDYSLLDVATDENSLNSEILQAGDIIEVPVISPQLNSAIVTILGEVTQPGPYPYFDGMTLLHVLTQSGGITTKANLEAMSLSRELSGGGLQNIDLQHQQGNIDVVLKTTTLQAGDVITIPTRATEGVLVISEGELKKPGEYFLKKGTRISDLLAMSGGLTDAAFTDGIAFYRESVAKKFDEQLNKLADQLEESLLKSQKAAIEGSLDAAAAKNAAIFEKQERLVARLRDNKSPGRVALEFPEDMSTFAGSHEDLILEEGDRIVIPSYPSTVNVLGQVFNPNTVAFNPKLKPWDYIEAAGGVTRSSDKENIFIVKANGMVVPLKKTSGKGSWITGRQKEESNLAMGPGDSVLVPEDFEIKINKLQMTKDVTQIMFQIIGTLGILVAAF